MADIVCQFPIWATPDKVFAAVATPAGIDTWWSLESAGRPGVGETYDLGFGAGHEWKAVVTRCEPETEIEWELTDAQDDWLGTRVGFRLERADRGTIVHFHHTGWPEANAHYRSSCYCWPMYLRLLKKFVETGEVVGYGQRLEA